MLKWILGPLAAALVLAPLAAAAAPPGGRPGPALQASADALVHEVQFRHHNGLGRGLGIGLGLGVLGAIIASEAYAPPPGYDEDDYAAGPPGAPGPAAGDPRTLCAQHFRSFEWNSGLYTTHSGEKRLCPYLR